MRRTLLSIVLVVGLVVAACGDDGGGADITGAADLPTASEVTPDRANPSVEIPDEDPPSKLVVTDLILGLGDEAVVGATVNVHYVGVSWSTGETFDASWDRGEPISFPLGSGRVIPGWEQGIEGMKVGGRRRLEIPPDLAYGPDGRPPVIAPNETLVFVVDLTAVEGPFAG